MRHRDTDRQETYRPMRDKKLHSVLLHLFVTEFGYDNRPMFAEKMIEHILETIQAFTKPARRLKPGQLLWMAVTNDGRKHSRKPMRMIPQVPVILDLVTDDDLKALAEGQEYVEVRRQRHARLLDQVWSQGGVLAQGDLCAITLMSKQVVSTDLARYRQEHNRILPYRGSIQDIGATLSHKVEVIRLLEAGYLETEIRHRLSMPHTLAAVENYVQTYKNVLKLIERGFSPSEVSGILSVSERLVSSYLEIIAEHHPELLAAQPRQQKAAKGAG